MVGFTDPQPKSFGGYIALQLHSGGKGNMRFRETPTLAMARGADGGPA